MEVSNFFSRLIQTSKETKLLKPPDDLDEFDDAWQRIKATLEQPDERQIVRGIASTQVPTQLRQIVDALVYESNRTDEDTTGACLEYFLKNDLLSQLERLCEPDRPYGIKAEVLRAINNLIVSLSERFLVHNAVHRPLRRLLRSCVGEEPEEKVDGGSRIVGAAGMSPNIDRKASNDDVGEDLVGLMCTLASRMVAYPPLLLIFFHDKGWLQPHPSRFPNPNSLDRALSPAPSGHTGISGPSSKTGTHHFEFLLFSYLLRFVHREGQIGDPARAGLLFLFDIAFLPSNEIVTGSSQLDNHNGSDPLQDARDALGEFILDGDFAEVMAAGLGAVYSLLPSKLCIPSLAELATQEQEQVGSSSAASGGMHLGAGNNPPDSDLPLSTDTEVHDQLDLILKLFGFLQDIIHRCYSTIHHADPSSQEISTTQVLGSAISESTLDAIQSSFLDNVLYPSILECSSHDGSAVAVLTYLDVLFSNLDDGPLLHRLLEFLMGGDTIQSTQYKKNKRNTGAMGYIDQPLHKAGYFAEEGRFTLNDLILDNLHSAESVSSTAALRLLRTLTSDHCQNSVKGLLSIIRDPTATALAKRPIPTELDMADDTFLPHPVYSNDPRLQEVELYSSLITRLDPSSSSAEVTAGYAVYLTDVAASIESDRCFRLWQNPLFRLADEEKVFANLDILKESPQHRLNPSDPLIKSILQSLGQFMGNTPDQNVALTGAISSITICPNRSLAGLLLYDIRIEADPWKSQAKHGKGPQSDYRSHSASDVDPDSDSDIDIDVVCLRTSAFDSFANRPSIPVPAIYQILLELIQSISSYRSSIDSFDRLLAERRQGLLFADHLDEAMNLMLDVEPSIFDFPETPNNEKKRPSAAGLVGGIKSFLTPKKRTPSSTPQKPTPTLGSMLGSTPKKVGPSTPIKVDELDMLNPSPFRSHYQQTSLELQLEPSESRMNDGPWNSRSPPILTPDERTISSSSNTLADAMSFNEGPSDYDQIDNDNDSNTRSIGDKLPKKVSLSVILDNCVLLEEFIKELVAIITVRRAIGIDQVGFI
ncbi:uncharacterized protein IL334_004715 [Kwoniella shivajii]|uniref:Retinoic acid induced 16-like protein-domain-containing protein n=1 Tax=Kwoniella shivajii TaxID=564305 RepID=A0ABZ1D1A1_9TREE|nr:hypothetical protein IL334_004715 [Kwoniella shivajii]